MFLQNSNLVLTAETRTREAAEPSGEPETLWGRMRGKMGDRVQFNKPEGLSEKKAKQKKKYATMPRPKCTDFHTDLLCALEHTEMLGKICLIVWAMWLAGVMRSWQGRTQISMRPSVGRCVGVQCTASAFNSSKRQVGILHLPGTCPSKGTMLFACRLGQAQC